MQIDHRHCMPSVVETNTPTSNRDASPAKQVLETFRSSVEAGWGAFVSLGDWEKRNDVIHGALSSPDIRALFLERYRQHMEPYFREEFYSLLESKKLEY